MCAGPGAATFATTCTLIDVSGAQIADHTRGEPGVAATKGLPSPANGPLEAPSVCRSTIPERAVSVSRPGTGSHRSLVTFWGFDLW